MWLHCKFSSTSSALIPKSPQRHIDQSMALSLWSLGTCCQRMLPSALPSPKARGGISTSHPSPQGEFLGSGAGMSSLTVPGPLPWSQLQVTPSPCPQVDAGCLPTSHLLWCKLLHLPCSTQGFGAGTALPVPLYKKTAAFNFLLHVLFSLTSHTIQGFSFKKDTPLPWMHISSLHPQ